VKQLRLPFVPTSFGIPHQTEFEQGWMERNDPFAHTSLQILVCASDERIPRDADAWDFIDEPNVGRIQLANFVQPHAAMERDQRHPIACILLVRSAVSEEWCMEDQLQLLR